MRRSHLVVVAVFLSFSVLLAFLFWQLPLAMRFYPLFLALSMGVVSLSFWGLLLYRKKRNKKGYRKDLHDIFAGFHAGQFFGVVLSSILFVIGYYVFGLYLAAFLYLLILLRYLQQTWQRSFWRSALFVALLYLILQVVLHFPVYGGVIWQRIR